MSEEELNSGELDTRINEEHEEEETLEKKVEKVDKIKKLLAQRNQARKEAEELRKEAELSKKLEKKIADLEEKFLWKELELEERKEAIDFYSKLPQAKQFESEIEKVKSEYNLSYEKAYKLYIAENKPELLVDPQYLNKSNSSNGAINWITPPMTDIKDPLKMSDADFEKWSNDMAVHSSMYDIRK